MRAKGGRGKADHDITYKGVVVKIDYKVGNDYQKPDQIKYQQRIEKALGNYRLVHNMHELYEIIDKIDAGESLRGELF